SVQVRPEAQPRLVPVQPGAPLPQLRPVSVRPWARLPQRVLRRPAQPPGEEPPAAAETGMRRVERTAPRLLLRSQRADSPAARRARRIQARANRAPRPSSNAAR